MSNPMTMPLAQYVVTCASEGCQNEGVAVEVTAPADAPVVVCGPCGGTLSAEPIEE